MSTETKDTKPDAESAFDSDVFHVTPHEEGWAVKPRGADGPALVARSRSEALAGARGMIRASGEGRVVVHGEDGLIEKQLTPRDIDDSSWTSMLRHPAAIIGAATAVTALGILGLFTARSR